MHWQAKDLYPNRPTSTGQWSGVRALIAKKPQYSMGQLPKESHPEDKVPQDRCLEGRERRYNWRRDFVVDFVDAHMEDRNA